MQQRPRPCGSPARRPFSHRSPSHRSQLSLASDPAASDLHLDPASDPAAPAAGRVTAGSSRRPMQTSRRWIPSPAACSHGDPRLRGSAPPGAVALAPGSGAGPGHRRRRRRAVTPPCIPRLHQLGNSPPRLQNWALPVATCTLQWLPPHQQTLPRQAPPRPGWLAKCVPASPRLQQQQQPLHWVPSRPGWQARRMLVGSHPQQQQQQGRQAKLSRRTTSPAGVRGS